MFVFTGRIQCAHRTWKLNGVSSTLPIKSPEGIHETMIRTSVRKSLRFDLDLQRYSNVIKAVQDDESRHHPQEHTHTRYPCQRLGKIDATICSYVY
ncbi:hypothetical protein M8J76_010516 [Diaphorina citri]|nr:hypothetical protein M8J76_010516 [Diaphorina citri]